MVSCHPLKQNNTRLALVMLPQHVPSTLDMVDMYINVHVY